MNKQVRFILQDDQYVSVLRILCIYVSLAFTVLYHHPLTNLLKHNDRTKCQVSHEYYNFPLDIKFVLNARFRLVGVLQTLKLRDFNTLTAFASNFEIVERILEFKPLD